MELFWIFTTISAITLLLLVLMFKKGATWGWNFLIIGVIVYAGLFKMTGTARDVWLFSTVEGIHGELEIVYHGVIPNKFIYLLVRVDRFSVPYYVRLPWDNEVAENLAIAAQKADNMKTELMIDAEVLSHGGKTNKKSKPGHGDVGKSGYGGEEDAGHGVATPDAKDGGRSSFYPKPVIGDPLKPHIEVVPVPPGRDT